MTAPKPTVVSLFAGIGGFDAALEQAGFETVGQVEKHPFCLDVLAKHWPDVPRHDDVVTATDWWLSEERPVVDVVCGGFPCQDISLAKADRQGLAGERSGLYWHAIEFAVAVRAKFVLLENVAGLLSSNGGRDFGLILASLAECGYPYLEWRVLDSQYFGLPQRRVRVFLVGSAGDPRLGPVLLEPEGRGRDLEALSKARQKTARAATRLHGEGRGAGDQGGPPADPDRVRETPRLPGRVDHLGETARTLLTSGQRGDQDSDNFIAYPDRPLIFHLPTSTLQGSVATEDPTARRGYRIDAEAAAGNQLVVSALTKNSAGHAGPDDNEAQANRLIVVGVGMPASPETARSLTRSAAKGGAPAVVEPNLVVYTKFRNARDNTDYEEWSQEETARTLNGFESSSVRTPHAVVETGVQPDDGCGCCPIDPVPDANRFGTCGNAVSVPVIRWIGLRLWDEIVAQGFAS